MKEACRRWSDQVRGGNWTERGTLAGNTRLASPHAAIPSFIVFWRQFIVCLYCPISSQVDVKDVRLRAFRLSHLDACLSRMHGTRLHAGTCMGTCMHPKGMSASWSHACTWVTCMHMPCMLLNQKQALDLHAGTWEVGQHLGCMHTSVQLHHTPPAPGALNLHLHMHHAS